MTHLSRLIALVCVVITAALASLIAARAGTPSPTAQRLLPTAEPFFAEIDENADAGLDTAAVSALLDRFHAAAAEADLEAYFACMTSDAVFLGTDASERWAGDAFRRFCEPHFKAGKGWTYTPHDRAIVLAPDGDAAWFDELLDNDKLGLCRGSGVAVRNGEEWRIAQYNLSIPVPNEIAGEVVRFIQAAEAQNNAP